MTIPGGVAPPPKAAAKWLFAHFIVTHRCNLACAHCYQAEHGVDRNELSLAEWTRVMDEAAAMGVLQLVLGGGEPLARRDFWELLAEARKRRFAVKLFTNGTLVGRDEARRLREAAVLEVAISLHHADKEAGDRFVRRKGSIDRINAAIDALESEGVRTQVKANVLADNARDLPELVTRFQGRPLVSLGFSDRMHASDDGSKEPLAQAPSERQLLEAARLSVSQLGRAELEHLLEEARRKVASETDGPTCGAGRTLLVVQPNGDVLPCNQTPSQVMGNVRQRGLAGIWAESAVGTRFRGLRRSQFEHEPGAPCPSCELKKVCSKCAALSFDETGRLTGYSETVCRSTKTRWAALRERAAELGLECPV